jgi:N-acetyl sugar amidotransferase
MTIKICKKCICDSTIPEIEFDEYNVCSYCNKFIPILEKKRESNKNMLEFNNQIKKIKKVKGKYNCLIGVSGGVDSSYMVHLAKKNSLNPLLVHFDNGWNSELAVSNIKKIAEKSNFDLQTYVVNWKEFKDIQRSFIKSGVVDIELVTDHAIFANLFKTAKKNNIKYILSGTNIFTEHAMPRSWMWRKTDFRNIKSIHKKYGKVKIDTYPRMGLLRWYLSKYFKFGIQTLELLNLIDYSKKNSIKELNEEYNWKNYEEKHYESFFTKFYQSYILPKKFNIDKRMVHYSCLIRNLEIKRKDALEQFHNNKFNINKEQLFYEDIKYFCKKLDFSISEFEENMKKKPVSHFKFNNSEKLFHFLKKVYFKINEEKNINHSSS